MAQDSTYTLAGVIEESTFGTTPSAALQLMNFSSFPSLRRTRNVQRPPILTNDRRRWPSRVTRESGELAAEAAMQFNNMMLFWEGLMANDQAALVTVGPAVTISFTGATGVIADSANGFGSLSNGDMVFISGAGQTANNGWKGPVTSAAAGSITVPAAQVVDEAAGASITISSRRLVDGNTPRSYSAEWQATQLTNRFRNGTGYRVGSINWRWEEDDFARESISLLGQTPSRAAATIGTGGPTASPVTEPMTTVGDFGTIYLAGSATSIIVSSLELVATSNINPLFGLGTLGIAESSTGPLDISINARVIYDDNADALLTNIEAHDTIDGVFWDLVDTAGNRVCFVLPAVKADDGNPEGGEAGTFLEMGDVVLTGHDPAKDPNSAYVSSGFGYQFGIFTNA